MQEIFFHSSLSTTSDARASQGQSCTSSVLPVPISIPAGLGGLTLWVEKEGGGHLQMHLITSGGNDLNKDL